MLARDLPLHLLALLVYPGLLMTLAVGAAAEIGVALALAGGGVRTALLAPASRLRQGRPADIAAPLLAALAATQLAAPLNPVSPVERNLLVAAVALVAITWLVRARAWDVASARRTLLVQLCWFAALLAPALVSESLRPQALGSVVVLAALPLKVTAGLLALLCLPALLPLQTSAGEGHELARARLLVWLPLCGLFVSLWFPPGPDDLGGALHFLTATLAAAAAAIGLAFATQRIGPLNRLYPPLLAPLALVVLGIAAVTSELT